MIRKITWSDIIDMLHKAKHEVFLVMPSIHEEWIETLMSNPHLKELSIYACIDNHESVIRNGYGSLNSIDALLELNATITECPGLKISFIATEDEAYFLFLESRILAGDPDGLNAVEVHPQDASVFLENFFNDPNVLKDGMVSQPLNNETFKKVKEVIKSNPPEEPDMKRMIGTYNTLFQYAELHLEGGNLTSKTISIPSSALPFKDVELKNKLKTRLSLFTKEITDTWTELSELKLKVDEVRKRYLITCSLRKDKSILKKSSKVAFKNEVEYLEILASEITKNLQNKVQSAINKSEDTLRNELTSFFMVNSPDGTENLDKENAKRHIEKSIDKVISKIDLPNAADLISKIKIKQMFYELTWEDLNDEMLVEWFLEKGLIDKSADEIANFSKAFKVRN